jgi:hypothetical protein
MKPQRSLHNTCYRTLHVGSAISTTATVCFGDVHIPKAGSTLWLPQEADVSWEYKGVAVEQQHLYSDFHLYAAHSKIVPQ